MLEAKWAAFFDNMGLRWEYEPFELRGWIPDFAIYRKSGKVWFLVEVRPEPFQNDAAAKIESSGAKGPVLLAGSTLANAPALGRSWRPGSSTWGWFFYNPASGTRKACATLLPLEKADEFKASLIAEFPGIAEATLGHWRDAGNAVQWRPSNKPEPVSTEPLAAARPSPGPEMSKRDDDEARNFFANLRAALRAGGAR